MPIKKWISGKARANVPATIPQISDVVDDLTNDRAVTRFTVEVDKVAGVIRCSALSSDGRIATKSILGPGLEEVVRYDPSRATTADRDTNIRTLLGKGLTQVEVAARLGVSQALVSKVHRSR